jgi:hypothetical protein
MKSILFSRPCHDVTLSYLHHHSKELVKQAARKYRVLNREKEQANKNEILELIGKQKPCFIMFNGHGAPDKIAGHQNEIIINKDNSEILSKTITYSLSCSSAQELGKIAVEKGCFCFIGYKDNFSLGKDPDSEASPGKDKIAKLFLESSNILVESLIQGKKVKDSIEKSKEKMRKNIWYLSTTKDFPEAQFYAPFLMNNYLSLVAHGDEGRVL